GLAALGGLAVALVLASIAAVSMSRRLRHASVTARSIAEGASTRIRDPGRDEIAVLSAAVDDMADALLERLQAEVAFSADVAHELRTPVTGLVSAAEHLGDGLPADLVRSQVARLRALVEDLLEISRLDSGAEPTHLAPARLLDLVPGATGDSEELVMAEPRRVDRIVANLVDNARKHARSEPRLRVEGASLLVEDDGAGFPAPLLDGEPRRFRRHSGAPGSGLGLAICFAQARAMGARIELSNNPAGGGRVRVSFTPAGATAAQEG
ncbi:MAG: HAMP domain-containing sensor histidine kinase, partial [Nocardioides sp.]